MPIVWRTPEFVPSSIAVEKSHASNAALSFMLYTLWPPDHVNCIVSPFMTSIVRPVAGPLSPAAHPTDVGAGGGVIVPPHAVSATSVLRPFHSFSHSSSDRVTVPFRSSGPPAMQRSDSHGIALLAPSLLSV